MANARPLVQNVALGGLGIFGIVTGVIVAGPIMAIAAPTLITLGSVALLLGGADELHKIIADKPVESEMESKNFMKDREFRKGIEQADRMMQEDLEYRRRVSNGLPPQPSFKENFKQLFGVKRAEAGELIQNERSGMGQLEPLQPIDDFIAGNTGRSDNDNSKRMERRAKLLERRSKTRTHAEGQSQYDISKLDVDNDSYDWCQCEEPQGCVATETMVQCVCSRCDRINREYARKTLQLLRRAKESGMQVKWVEKDAESRFRMAVGEK